MLISILQSHLFFYQTGWHLREFCKTQFAGVKAHVIIAELLIRARGIAHILGGKVELTDEGDYIEPTNEQKLETERYLLEQIAEYRQKCDFEKAADFEGYLQKFRKREYRKVENVAEAFGEITAAFGALEKEFERLGWMKTHTLINLGLGGFLFHGKNKHFAIK